MLFSLYKGEEVKSCSSPCTKVWASDGPPVCDRMMGLLPYLGNNFPLLGNKLPLLGNKLSYLGSKVTQCVKGLCGTIRSLKVAVAAECSKGDTGTVGSLSLEMTALNLIQTFVSRFLAKQITTAA